MSDELVTRSNRIEVVSAAVIRDGRLLLAQRAPTASHPWCWVTPGGQVEEGEEWMEALHCELGEEICLAPPDRDHAHHEWWKGLGERWSLAYTHEGIRTTTGVPFRLRCYTTIARPGDFEDLVPDDGIIGLGWYLPEEVAGLRLGPADTANRETLIRLCAVEA